MLPSHRHSQQGFTLIELVVVLAILGILLGLAAPRYLGTRRNALLPEAENTLSELKTLAWAYYQQYGDWTGLTAANYVQTFGFVATPVASGACWSYTMPADGGAASVQFQAQGNPAGALPKCDALGAPGAATVTLQLNNDGSSVRTQVLP